MSGTNAIAGALQRTEHMPPNTISTEDHRALLSLRDSEWTDSWRDGGWDNVDAPIWDDQWSDSGKK